MHKSSMTVRGFTAASLSVTLILLTACSGAKPPETTQTPAPAATTAAPAPDLEAREAQLAQREAALAAKEQEQENAEKLAATQAAQREADAKAKKAAQARRNAAAQSTPVVASPAPTPVVAPAKVPEPVQVPAGTQLTAALSSNLSTKTNKPGDPFEARLTSDLMIDGERVVPAGSRVTGTVANIVSGSSSIGAVPLLSLKFNQLELAEGRQIPIAGEYMQEGKSEKGRDTAKILGGAAAGAILGHQVKNNDTGTVVGGILGGAAGAVVAKKTGTEVELADGTAVTITLSEGFKVARN